MIAEYTVNKRDNRRKAGVESADNVKGKNSRICATEDSLKA